MYTREFVASCEMTCMFLRCCEALYATHRLPGANVSASVGCVSSKKVALRVRRTFSACVRFLSNSNLRSRTPSAAAHPSSPITAAVRLKGRTTPGDRCSSPLILQRSSCARLHFVWACAHLRVRTIVWKRGAEEAMFSRCCIRAWFASR